MNWLLILNDEICRKELRQLVHQHSPGILFKEEADKVVAGIGHALHRTGYEMNRRYITVNSSNDIYLLRVDEIMHCQSYQSYTQFHMSGGKRITATKTLKQVETMLKRSRFARIHQSHLVNVEYIDKYVKGNGGHLMLKDGTKLPVAARKKENLLRELEQINS